MKTFATFYEATLPKDVEQLPDGTYKRTRDGLTWYALDPQMTKLHRIDGPASISSNCKMWVVNGKTHRIGGPAIAGVDYEQWWVNGQLHRVDGPAIIEPKRKEWHVNGQQHRIDGPAVIEPGREEWYVNDQRHRIGGPAFVTPKLVKWFIEGVEFTEEDYNNLMKRLSNLTDASDKEATIAAATMFD